MTPKSTEEQRPPVHIIGAFLLVFVTSQPFFLLCLYQHYLPSSHQWFTALDVLYNLKGKKGGMEKWKREEKKRGEKRKSKFMYNIPEILIQLFCSEGRSIKLGSIFKHFINFLLVLSTIQNTSLQ